MTAAETQARRAILEAGLPHFAGSETFYRHWTQRLIYTEGVRFLANEAGAFWLIEVVASHQLTPEVAREPFQVWQLTVTRRRRATVKATDGNGKVVALQRIKFTDFPLDEITLYLEGGTLMLPGER